MGGSYVENKVSLEDLSLVSPGQLQRQNRFPFCLPALGAGAWAVITLLALHRARRSAFMMRPDSPFDDSLEDDSTMRYRKGNLAFEDSIQDDSDEYCRSPHGKH